MACALTATLLGVSVASTSGDYTRHDDNSGGNRYVGLHGRFFDHLNRRFCSDCERAKRPYDTASSGGSGDNRALKSASQGPAVETAGRQGSRQASRQLCWIRFSAFEPAPQQGLSLIHI